MGHLTEHAQKEMTQAWDLSDDFNKEMYLCILELIEVFENQKHSEKTALFCIDTFSKLALMGSIDET